MTQPVNAGKGAIFDLDGTLLDSMGVWAEVDRIFFERRGIPMPADYAHEVAAMQFGDIADYTIRRFSLDEDWKDLMSEWNDTAQELYATKVRPKPHALNYLHHLRNTGARLAVATSLAPRLRETALEHAGIRDCFDMVCSVDDAGPGGKERPDIFLHAARGLGLPPERCTVFEDILIAVRTAKSLGMRVWAMYDSSSDRDWERICQEADGGIHDFEQAPLRI
ncbi:HAD family hydrolase [Bifidobacterium indicum]|uniref:HAD family hydrolase n=1 Tax=Bifidobacterium indicum TaxID=1691 RepID=UPI0030DACAF1